MATNKDVWTEMKNRLKQLGGFPDVQVGEPSVIAESKAIVVAIVPDNGRIDEVTLVGPREVHRVKIVAYMLAYKEPFEDTEFRLDDVRARVEADYFGHFTLGGKIAYAMPVDEAGFAWDFGYQDIGQLKYRVVEITFTYRLDDQAAFAA